MTGYSTTKKAYELWDATVGKVVISGDVIFEEHSTDRAQTGSLFDSALARGYHTDTTLEKALTVKDNNEESSLPESIPVLSQQLSAKVQPTASDVDTASSSEERLGRLKREQKAQR